MRYLFLLFFFSGTFCEAQIVYPEGGFRYPDSVAAGDTIYYHYPMRDTLSKRELFADSYEYLLYQPLNEPNISLRPQQKETFRFIYSGRYTNYIIRLTGDSLFVKKGNPAILYKEDTTQLSAIENLHLRILRRYFPVDDTTGKSPYRKHYLDSMVKLYPQLLDPVYYHKLHDRTIAKSGEPFSYEETKLPVTKQQYDSVVSQINVSGFWTMPRYNICEDPPADGASFSLEANTKTKYNYVGSTDCPDDTTRFTKACQSLVDLAKLDDKIQLILSGEVITAPIEDVPLKDIRRRKHKKR